MMCAQRDDEKPTFYASARVLHGLAEHLIIAARKLTDKDGLLVRAPIPAGDPRVLGSYDQDKMEAATLAAIEAITGCKVEKR